MYSYWSLGTCMHLYSTRLLVHAFIPCYQFLFGFEIECERLSVRKERELVCNAPTSASLLSEWPCASCYCNAIRFAAVSLSRRRLSACSGRVQHEADHTQSRRKPTSCQLAHRRRLCSEQNALLHEQQAPASTASTAFSG